ncbi:hypothetical protein C9I86_02650 [Photobacterium sp. NCIMB 13483]|uniref:Uncharacterized protein n=1 Tax=Photobacterium piscicola TaxID=1378299 RepID=A0A1T5HWK3_9GAMM|nr:MULTISPECIES: hypothetical protein [Photobacterium]PST94267.1 hypothetical protein C9I86_02650 [Photobacterium sp. NCIMB 13483]SKC31133.1 hypothetical protein CZ809_00611 [Photobacterium piscicola]
MLIFIRTLLLMLFIIFTASSSALTLQQYTQQYALLPCTGLETRIDSFKKRLPMMLSTASKREYEDLKREYKALNELYKKKNCHKRNSR